LAAEQPGFLGIETARSDEGITVCYWTDEEAIAAWRAEAEHRSAQERAGEWYRQYVVRVARVERAYGSTD
ncbi:MAG: antibiotic biosynthesis monooxygenase, partial [Actinomycetota bacterium]